MEIFTAESSITALLNVLREATDPSDRSGTNLETLQILFERMADEDSISVNSEAVAMATEILSVIQTWGDDDSTRETLQEYSAK